jgi:activator of 2-hydroxyglutaryl-CoA dehydratase
MAKKEWKKIDNSRWIHTEHKDQIHIIKPNFRNVYGVILDNEFENKILREFQTRKEAEEFATKYMRSHTNG